MAFKTAQAETQLDKNLKEFGLEFLAPKLKGINDIGRLSSGLAGRTILAELGNARLQGEKNDAEIAKTGIAAFQKLSDVRKDFNAKFTELSGQKGITTLQASALAFRHANEVNAVSALEGASLSEGLSKGIIDCDLSSYIFIQLGREKGLDLIGASLMDPDPKKRWGHYVAVSRKKGKPEFYVETTGLLFGTIMKISKNKAALLEAVLLPPQKFAKDYAGKQITNELGDNKIIAIYKNTVQAKETEAQLKEAEVQMAEMKKLGKAVGMAMIAMALGEFYESKVVLSGDRPKIREAYDKIAKMINGYWAEYKNKDDYDFGFFKMCFKFIDICSAAGIDNEKDLFSFYLMGAKLFGKEALKKEGIELTFKQEILNPLDYIGAIRKTK